MAELNAILTPQIRTGRGAKTDNDKAQRFVRLVTRANFLVTALEPARAPGMDVATATAHTLWERERQITPGGRTIITNDVMGSDGTLAPMTGVGAAAAKDEAAIAQRDTRVGNIFDHLLGAAKRNEMIVSESGYDLAALGSAIQKWLDQKLRSIPDAEALASAELRLQAEIVRFLTSYHGT
jgi:hypothetical protein